MERLGVRRSWLTVLGLLCLTACDTSSSGGSNATSVIPSNAPQLAAATVVDIDGGGPGEGDVVLLRFDRPVVFNTGASDGQVQAIGFASPTDTFGAGAVQSQSVPGTEQIEIVLGEDPQLFAGLPDEVGVSTVNVLNGSGTVVPIEGTNGVRAAPSRRGAGLEDVTGNAPMALSAEYFDTDNDGLVGVGDVLLVTFDQPVLVPDGDPAGGAFALPVAGDTFGTGAILEPASETPTNRGVRVVLGDAPVLTVDGVFSSAATAAGSPTGVTVAAGAVVTDAVLGSGAPVAAGVELDLGAGDPNLFGDGRAAEATVGAIDPFTPALTAQGVESPGGLDTFDGMLTIGSLTLEISLLFVADTANDRVLVFENVPSGSFPAASWVLGQETLESEAQADPTRRDDGRADAGTLRAPADVAYDVESNRLFVSDAGNHRVLVWREVFEIEGGRLTMESGRDADYVLGQPDLRSSQPNRGAVLPSTASLSGPQGLSIAGGRLAIADAGNHRVLLFNTIPDDGAVVPSAVLGQSSFDGGDPNAGGAVAAETLHTPRDVFLSDDLALPASAGALCIADSENHRVVIYERSAWVTGGSASFVLGQADKMTAAIALTASGLNSPTGVYADTAAQLLYVVDSGHHRVMVYDAAALADGLAGAAIGQADATSGMPNRGGAPGAETLRGPTAVDSVAGVLIVSDTSNHRALFYGVAGLPLVHEDAFEVLGQMDFASVAPSGRPFSRPGDVLLVAGRLVLSDTANHRVLVFNGVPRGNPVPDVVLGQPDDISFEPNRGGAADASTLKWPTGLATDGVRLVVSDSGNHRVLIWDTLPVADGTPADVVLGQEDANGELPNSGAAIGAETFDTPVGLSVADDLLAVSDSGNHRVLLFEDFAGLSDFAEAEVVVGQPDFVSREANRGEGISRFSLRDPRGVLLTESRLYVSDSGNHRVLIWKPVPDGRGQGADRVFGQGGFDLAAQASPSSGSLLYPTGLATDADASVIYVADSGRHRVVVYDDVRGGPPFVPARHVLGQPNLATDQGQEVDGVSLETLHCPQGIFFNGYELLVSDQGNSRLSIFR